VSINGTLIASHDFGSLTEGQPEFLVLTGTYTPTTSGYYTLDIENSRPVATDANVKNFIDNIKVVPTEYMLATDGQTFPFWYPTTVNFYLTAGPEMANRDYWMWTNFSGTYPGVVLNGITVPLNYDPLVSLCLDNPGLIHSDFIGQLDGSGHATIPVKIQTSYIGLTLYFSYIVLSPGGGQPILAASNPVNITVTQFY
jgi:hypothetical protein